MSLAKTKEQLVMLLADSDNKVLALSGKWGTGKSFLWEEVKNLSNEEQVKNCLYISLFGLSSIDEVKIKLIQSAIPFGDSTVGATAKQFGGVATTILEHINKGFGAIRDIGLVAAPNVLKERLIVLDDIERKHEKFNIDEVLGFIDEFTKRYDSRFLLILNSDQLRDHAMWATMREKVIDQELKLATSSEEAFGIATEIVRSAYAEKIKSVIAACGVTNIRIICKVIKVVNQILGARDDLTDAVLSRTIPSTVLLACIHYKGIDDGPDFEFVLSSGKMRRSALLKKMKQPKAPEKEETAEEKRNAKWHLLMTKLGLYGCDEFELVVVDFLESGLFDASKITAIIDQYISESDRTETTVAAHTFCYLAEWDHRATISELLKQGQTVAEKAHLLDADTVSHLHETLILLDGGEPLAKNALDRWINVFKEQTRNTPIETRTPFRNKRHPDIQAAFDEINAAIQANTTGLDACLYIVKNSGWSTRQQIAMNSMTALDMEQLIREGAIDDMKLFTLTMLDWLKNPGTYQQHFGPALSNFVDACKLIVDDTASKRLGRLIRELYEGANLSHLLSDADSSRPSPSAALDSQ